MSDGGHRRSSERRAIALQVRLAFGDVGEFVDRYAINISEGGIFIRSREPRPVGSKLKFELHLRTGEVVFAGEGTVRWRQVPDARGLGVAGMGLQFDHLTDESRDLLRRIIDLREEEQAPPPVEGASPASWRPLEEFPPLPVEPEEEKSPPPPPPLMRPSKEPAPPPQALPAPPVRAPLGRVNLVSRGVSLGIDVGWSALRVAAAAGERVRPLAASGTPGFSALVADLGNRWCVGEEAERAVASGARAVRGVSQLLGQWSESSAAASWRKRQIDRLANDDAGRAAFQIAGGLVAPRELVRAMLAEVKSSAEAQLRAPVSKAVFAVPSGWADSARRALREAAEECGLRVEGLVAAPLASTLACHGTRGRRRLLSIHFGEGTFEAAVVEQAGHVFDLVGSSTDSAFGEIDLEALLIESVLAQFERDSGLLVPEDAALYERTRVAVAETRRALEESLEHELYLPGFVESGLSRADLRQKWTRARLLQLTAPAMERAFEVARGALAARGLGGADLDEILFFGSRGAWPQLARKLAEKLGREPARPDSGDDSAAIGAAMIAEGSGQLGRYVMAGAVGASVLIGLPGGGVKRVIERDLPLPVERGYTIATAQDGQTELELFLFQGESAKAFENEYVGALKIGPFPPLPRGESRVTLSLSLNEGGELTVRGRVVGTSKTVPVHLDRNRRPEAARQLLLPR